jgi:KDO2-lipid IV(A) lauroyltransferase
MINRCVLALAIVAVYFVYLPALRLLGPRCAVLASQALAWLHWLLTFAGVERDALRALRQVLPVIRPELRPRRVLRQYLACKHRLFVEYDLFSTARGRRYMRDTYLVEGREHLDAAVAGGRGAILLVFHYGLALPLFGVLRLQFGHETSMHLGQAPHLGRAVGGLAGTFGWAVRAAIRTSAAADQFSGPPIYQHPNFTFLMLLRRLGRKGLVGMNADGMGGTDFVEAPFLGGTLRLPTGPARLSARAGAPILPVFALPEGLSRHRLVIHPPLRCDRDDRESVRATVAAYAAVLDGYVRAHPWAWWSWRRLDVQRHPDGSLRLDLRRVIRQGDYGRVPQAAARAASPAASL